MIRRLLGPVGGPLLFFVVAALVFGGLGWVTVASLEIEEAQRQTVAKAALDANIRVALWRLDGRMLPALGAEDNRPFHHYLTGEADSAYGPASAPLLDGRIADWLKLHFQLDPETGWESPQVLTPDAAGRLKAAWAGLNLRNVTSDRAELLAEFRRRRPIGQAVGVFAARDRTTAADSGPLAVPIFADGAVAFPGSAPHPADSSPKPPPTESKDLPPITMPPAEGETELFHFREWDVRIPPELLARTRQLQADPRKKADARPAPAEQAVPAFIPPPRALPAPAEPFGANVGRGQAPLNRGEYSARGDIIRKGFEESRGSNELYFRTPVANAQGTQLPGTANGAAAPAPLSSSVPTGASPTNSASDKFAKAPETPGIPGSGVTKGAIVAKSQPAPAGSGPAGGAAPGGAGGGFGTPKPSAPGAPPAAPLPATDGNLAEKLKDDRKDKDGKAGAAANKPGDADEKAKLADAKKRAEKARESETLMKALDDVVRGTDALRRSGTDADRAKENKGDPKPDTNRGLGRDLAAGPPALKAEGNVGAEAGPVAGMMPPAALAFTPAVPTPPPPPIAVHLGSMRPQWVTAADGTETLVLVRAAQLQDRTVYQGVVLDWPRLQVVLKDEVKDLFPDAKLLPVADPDGVSRERAMSALPVQLDPGPAPELPPAGWSPLRFGLVLAWAAAAIAFAAAGLTSWSLMDLAERRIRFVSAVTHELRTPLTSLRLYLDLLLSGMVRDEQKRQEYLATLNVESDRLHRLIDNVLDFSRLETRRRGTGVQTLKVCDLLDQVRQTWADRCGNDGKELVVISTLPVAAEITTDPAMVQQIVGNLIDNARKYTRDAADRRIWLWAKPGGRRLVIEVEDRGPGVAKAERKLIFRPFRRGGSADTTAGGAGLGLALSKQWAELLGGRLTYRSADGGIGSCFRLELRQRG